MDYTNDRGQLLALLKKNLSEEKYIHSLATEKQAIELAELFGVDTQKAGFAGLMHDVTKCFDDVALARKYGIVKYTSKKTLHQTTGAIYLEKEGITRDADVLAAVAFHTTGCADMTDLQKIIYLADAIEPNRRYPEVDRLRELAHTDLDAAMRYSLATTVERLKSRNLPIDENTILAYNSFNKSFRRDA